MTLETHLQKLNYFIERFKSDGLFNYIDGTYQKALSGKSFDNISPVDESFICSVPQSNIDDIERAILEADLGFNPSNNGNSIMITFPPLSVERRQELVKVASKIIEDGRISIRNIRREIIQSAKRIEDEQNISEDEMKKFMDDIQEVTDSFINRLNALQKDKEVEILDS